MIQDSVDLLLKIVVGSNNGVGASIIAVPASSRVSVKSGVSMTASSLSDYS